MSSDSGASVTGAASRWRSRSAASTALLGLEEEVEGALAGLGACRHGSADPTEVGPVAGVDLDLRARLEEQRDRHLGAGLQGGGLGPPGGAVALEAGSV